MLNKSQLFVHDEISQALTPLDYGCALSEETITFVNCGTGRMCLNFMQK